MVKDKVIKHKMNVNNNNVKKITNLTNQLPNAEVGYLSQKQMRFEEFPCKFQTALISAMEHFYQPSDMNSYVYEVEHHNRSGVMNQSINFVPHQNQNALNENTIHVMTFLYYYNVSKIETSLKTYEKRGTFGKIISSNPLINSNEYPISQSDVIAFTDTIHQPFVKHSTINSKRKLIVILVTKVGKRKK